MLVRAAPACLDPSQPRASVPFLRETISPEAKALVVGASIHCITVPPRRAHHAAPRTQRPPASSADPTAAVKPWRTKVPSAGTDLSFLSTSCARSLSNRQSVTRPPSRSWTVRSEEPLAGISPSLVTSFSSLAWQTPAARTPTLTPDENLGVPNLRLEASTARPCRSSSHLIIPPADPTDPEPFLSSQVYFTTQQ